MAHFELIAALELLSNFYGTLILVQIGNLFISILYATYNTIRVHVFTWDKITGELSKDESKDPVKLVADLLWYLYLISRIILLTFSVESLSNQKASTIAILKRYVLPMFELLKLNHSVKIIRIYYNFQNGF